MVKLNNEPEDTVVADKTRVQSFTVIVPKSVSVTDILKCSKSSLETNKTLWGPVCSSETFIRVSLEWNLTLHQVHNLFTILQKIIQARFTQVVFCCTMFYLGMYWKFNLKRDSAYFSSTVVNRISRTCCGPFFSCFSLFVKTSYSHPRLQQILCYWTSMLNGSGVWDKLA